VDVVVVVLELLHDRRRPAQACPAELQADPSVAA
jgi:hypothetical protein